MANLSNINNVLRVSSNLRVGINTDAASYALEIGGTNSGIKLKNSGGSGKVYSILSDTSGNFQIYDDAAASGRLVISSGGDATFAGTVLIDGVSNYTGLVVKGSGASRPAITWSNVNQGDLGIIYGTENNALVIATGASGLAALTLDSSQNSTFAGSVTGTTAIFSGSGTILSLNRNAPGTALIELKIANTIEGYLGATTAKSFVVYNEAGSEKAHVENNGNIGLYGSAINFLIGDFAEINFRESGAITIDSDNNQSIRSFQFKDGDGSSLMFIKDTGYVGIGTTSPLVRLQLERTVSATTSRTAPVNLMYLTSEHPSVGYTGFGTAITHYSRTYQNSTKTEQSKIAFTQQGDSVSTSGSTIDFYTKTLSTGSAAPEIRMRVNYNGNVGIGTISPERILHLDADQGRAIIQLDKGGDKIVSIGTGSSATGADDTILQLINEGVEKVRIFTEGNSWFNGGNVGINTTSPNSKLTVSGPATPSLANGENSIRIESHSSAAASPGVLGNGINFAQKWWSGSADLRVTGGIYGIKNAGNGTYGGGLAFYTQPSSAADMAQRMVINTDGNVTKPTSCAFSASTVTPGVSVGTTEVKIAYSSEQVDANSNYDTTNYRFTAPIAGNYLIGTNNTCKINTGVTVYMAIYIRKNGVGTSYRFRGGGVDNDVNDWFGINGSVVMPLAAGDYIELWGYANAGSFQIVNTEGHFYGYLIG
jgi:hypothetical protein